MLAKPGPPYKYICHVVDHFTKFRCLFPLINKCAKEFSKGLMEEVLSIFGLATILYSDNGKEFVSDIIKAILLFWPGQCNSVHGNPGHSQSQGVVEQGNRTIELMISARETDINKCNWSRWLPEVQSMCIVYLFTVYPPKPNAFIWL